MECQFCKSENVLELNEHNEKQYYFCKKCKSVFGEDIKNNDSGTLVEKKSAPESKYDCLAHCFRS